MKFRFRWKANGHENEAVVEADNYPMACFNLALYHASTFLMEGAAEDFELDLTKPERVEE